MERGEKVVLTGANGIGKTTLLKSILGMIKPLDGFAQLGDYLSDEIYRYDRDTHRLSVILGSVQEEQAGMVLYQ